MIPLFRRQANNAAQLSDISQQAVILLLGRVQTQSQMPKSLIIDDEPEVTRSVEMIASVDSRQKRRV